MKNILSVLLMGMPNASELILTIVFLFGGIFFTIGGAVGIAKNEKKTGPIFAFSLGLALLVVLICLFIYVSHQTPTYIPRRY